MYFHKDSILCALVKLNIERLASFGFLCDDEILTLRHLIVRFVTRVERKAHLVEVERQGILLVVGHWESQTVNPCDLSVVDPFMCIASSRCAVECH